MSGLYMYWDEEDEFQVQAPGESDLAFQAAYDQFFTRSVVKSIVSDENVCWAPEECLLNFVLVDLY